MWLHGFKIPSGGFWVKSGLFVHALIEDSLSANCVSSTEEFKHASPSTVLANGSPLLSA